MFKFTQEPREIFDRFVVVNIPTYLSCLIYMHKGNRKSEIRSKEITVFKSLISPVTVSLVIFF